MALSQANELEPLPMNLSKARSKISLAKAESDGKLTFRALVGDKQASFDLADLTAPDRALLARLVARYRPSDRQAQASAGLYMEFIGNTKVADEYYKKVGAELKEQLDGLFE